MRGTELPTEATKAPFRGLRPLMGASAASYRQMAKEMSPHQMGTRALCARWSQRPKTQTTTRK